MRNTLLALIGALLLTSCYQEPLEPAEPPQESTICTTTFSDGYAILLPCDSEVLLFSPDGDPGVGIISYESTEVYYRCAYNLFDEFGDMLEFEGATTPYYTTWRHGNAMIVQNERYQRPGLFVYLWDRNTGLQFEFWTMDLAHEDQIVRQITSLH